jgi:hypothetical protein
MCDGELRLLDLQVAEKVFGYDRLTARVDPMNRNGEPQYHMGYPHGHDFAPFYSIDIAAAFTIVEKMWPTWQVEMVNCYKLHTLITDHVRIWYVRFIDNENDMNNWSAEADSLPEAICQAALKSIENTAKEPQQ